MKIATHIFAAETFACISVAEASNCIIATETVSFITATKRSANISVAESTTNIIAKEPQNLHDCNGHWHLCYCYRKCQLHSSNRNCYLQNWKLLKALICKASLIFKASLELPLSIILKERELYESKHVAVKCRCLKRWDLLSFLTCSSILVLKWQQVLQMLLELQLVQVKASGIGSLYEK